MIPVRHFESAAYGYPPAVFKELGVELGKPINSLNEILQEEQENEDPD